MSDSEQFVDRPTCSEADQDDADELADEQDLRGSEVSYWEEMAVQTRANIAQEQAWGRVDLYANAPRRRTDGLGTPGRSRVTFHHRRRPGYRPTDADTTLVVDRTHLGIIPLSLHGLDARL